MSSASSTRKNMYKATTIGDSFVSQDQRRIRMLEDQKRRRASRIDEARFANLTIGFDDDEDDEEDPQVVRQGISSFASMLAASSSERAREYEEIVAVDLPESFVRRKKRRTRQIRAPESKSTPSQWADRCMYAELLEMRQDDPYDLNCGLPEDIETGWIAVAPVPVGKRCLAVVHYKAGHPGQVPNTSLRSRMLGKPLMPMFPSSLPPNSVLDCILDEDWKRNGILHVLDVLKWKGQNLDNCEATMRFWYRDTRLSEIALVHPPSPALNENQPARAHNFTYPTNLHPIPYHTDTTLSHLSNYVIPTARASRTISVHVPASAPDGEMQVDSTSTTTTTTRSEVITSSDGLLLYVSEAAYESGTSPLSCWVPLKTYEERGSEADKPPSLESPLDQFERLVVKRLGHSQSVADQEMEVDAAR